MDTSEVVIKSLKDMSEEDAKQLEPLWAKFKKETIDIAYFNYNDSPHQHWLSDFQSGKVKILVAVYNDKIIGFVLGQIKKDPVFNKYESAYISGIYLEPKYRGKNIADNMFNEMMSWFKGNNKSVVRLNTMGANKKAQQFYSKMGFVPEIITMRNRNSKEL